ncbi:hypothetical protein [Niabella sp.]|uniref:hypothetical protein n=1 Tax=Niabella sp. TaxID=1962976 RepID=UPI002620BC5E|nr:hypothetical protein [Niabella sp.]
MKTKQVIQLLNVLPWLLLIVLCVEAGAAMTIVSIATLLKTFLLFYIIVQLRYSKNLKRGVQLQQENDLIV